MHAVPRETNETPTPNPAALTTSASRAALLIRMKILDSPAEPAFDAIAEAAAALLGAPFAALALIDADRLWFKAAVGWAVGEMPRLPDPTDPPAAPPALLVVGDASLDPRWAAHPLVSGAPGLRFVAACPLLVDGVEIGSLLVADTRARTIDAAQARSIEGLGAAAAELLAARCREADAVDDQQRLRDFARASGDWLWETDAELRYTFVTEGITAATGESPAELIGRPIADAALLDDHGRPEPGAWHRLLRRQTPFVRALAELQVDGRTVHVSYGAVPVRDAGQRFRGWRGSARDVSSRRQSDLWARQQHLLLQRITAQVPGVIFRVRRRDDGLPQFLYLSPAAPVLFGFSAEAACADPRLVTDRIHREDRAGLLAQFASATANATPFHAEYRMVLPGKRVHWIETRALPERGADGGVIWNGYSADISKRKQAELALREAQSASRTKSEFLSRVSHELRTPLNSILGFTQLLALDTAHPLQPQQRRQMHNVQHAGRHLLGLIDDLLQLSSLENRAATLKLGSVDLGATLAVCLELLAPQARRSGVVLFEAPAGPAFVRANRRALEQVLMNLLSNAVKYNRRGGTVEMTLAVDAERVMLAIHDQGPGLSPTQQERLFQPFERLGAERGPVQGSGLGLVITRDLVQAMGGTLAVHSQPGAGSVFTLALEAGDAQAASVPGAFVDSIDDAALEPLPSARRVLYVEDDPLNVLLMEEVIRRTPSWSMTVADGGLEGLRAARVMQPDLVLLDINLPDLNGTEIVAALRADPATSRLRCIALSADAMSEQIDAAMAAGFDDYWLKPLDVAALIEQFDRLARAPASSWTPLPQS